MISQAYMNYLDELKGFDCTQINIHEEWNDLIAIWHSKHREMIKDQLFVLARIGLDLLGDTSDHISVLKDLHVAKNSGYSGDNPDPWANFRKIEDFGFLASLGVLTRLCDKYARFNTVSQNPDFDKVQETANDTLLDFIAYCIILCCLLDEGSL